MNHSIEEKLALEICQSGDFTNHRSLAITLEKRLENLFDCTHAVIVGNESLAIIMAIAGMQIDGKIAVSADSPNFIHGAILWAGLESVVYDSKHGHKKGLTDFLLNPKENDAIEAILICDFMASENLTPIISTALSENLKIIIYQCGYFAKVKNENLLYNPTHCTTIASIGENSQLITNNCACIFTSNDQHARTFRNIRSSYGARETMQVKATANGRVSEFQAGLALNFLENFEK